MKEVAVGQAEMWSQWSEDAMGRGVISTPYQLEDGRRVWVATVVPTGEGEVALPLFLPAKQRVNLERRHRWWGEPGPWTHASRGFFWRWIDGDFP